MNGRASKKSPPSRRCAGFVLPAVLILVLAGCAIKQEASLAVDGSGSVSFRFDMEDFFIETLVEMATLEGDNRGLEEGEVFDLVKIREEFAKKPEITLTGLSSPSPDVLEGSFTFPDVEEVFQSEAELTRAGVISYTREGGSSTIRLHLDRENFGQIASFLPMHDNPFFEMFNPKENEDTTEAEYLEMMEFVFGKGGPPGILASVVELKVNVDGKIVSQSGGRVSGRSVVFHIPLIRVLLLDQPLDYAIVFR